MWPIVLVTDTYCLLNYYPWGFSSDIVPVSGDDRNCVTSRQIGWNLQKVINRFLKICIFLSMDFFLQVRIRIQKRHHHILRFLPFFNRNIHNQAGKIAEKAVWRSVFLTTWIAYSMPIQQKLTPPVWLFGDFAGWVHNS